MSIFFWIHQGYWFRPNCERDKIKWIENCDKRGEGDGKLMSLTKNRKRRKKRIKRRS